MTVGNLVLGQESSSGPIVRRSERFAVTPPFRELPRLSAQGNYPSSLGMSRLLKEPSDSLFDFVEQAMPSSGSNFSVGLSFLGLGHGFPNDQTAADMPNTSMAVGATELVQWTDPVYAVFDKSTGHVLAGPVLGNTLWASLTGSSCAHGTAGSELIVEYDKANQRWLLAENTAEAPYATCIAVSTSSDALGSYYLFEFPQGSNYWADPKWGVWSNGYYQSEGEYNSSGTYLGPEICAYESAKLVVGDGTAEQICFQLSPDDGLPLPADVDSSIAPPANQDEFLMSLWDPSHLSLYSMHPDYQNPQNSTVTGNNGSQLTTVPTFTPACNGLYDDECVPQEGVTTELRVLGDRLSYRLAYWDDTPSVSVRATPPLPLPSQHWYVLHDTTASGGNEAPRWYEFTAPQRAIPVTDISLFQSGTFAPDSNYRWMGSLARDKNHDILLGYNESNSNMYPSIAVTGRTLQDPMGTMENEQFVLNGTGSLLTPPGFWGEYSSMRIDQDGCTFWYTNEFVMETGGEWSTQIGSVRFTGCQ